MSHPETLSMTWSAREQEQRRVTSRALLFVLEDTTYGVTVDVVRRVIELPSVVPVAGSSNWFSGMANVDGLALPLVDIQALFDYRPRLQQEPLKRAIFIDSAHGTLLLAVDQIATLSDLSAAAKHSQPPSNYPAEFLEYCCESNGVTIGVLNIMKLFKATSVEVGGYSDVDKNNNGAKV